MAHRDVRRGATLPPGRAKLSTIPWPTGSPMIGNTIDTVRVACSNGLTVDVPWARMTAGASAGSADGTGSRVAGSRRDDLAAASILQEYEARIGALEQLVGKLVLENEFLNGRAFAPSAHLAI
jgi:hypothetical protein